MNGAEMVSRPVFYTLAVWQVVVFYLMGAAALAVFGCGVYRRVRKYRRGRREPAERLTWKRLALAFATVISHRAIFRQGGLGGVAHFLVFLGFGGLFIATNLVLVDNDFLKYVIPSLQFLKGTFYLVFSWCADMSGVLLLAGLFLLAARRGFFRPLKLCYMPHPEAPRFPPLASFVREDWLFLLLLLAAGLGGFLVEALRINSTWPPFERASFIGWGLAFWLDYAGVTPGRARAVFRHFWFLHAISAFAFIAYIPYGKAWHMLLGWVSLALKPDDPGKGFARAIQGQEGGYARLEDMSRGEVIFLDACIRCGRCHEMCPATTAGYALSPRDLILDLRDFADKAAARPAAAPGAPPALAGEVVPVSWLWACTTCFACDDICPLGVAHVPFVVQLRRQLVSKGELDAPLQDALTHLGRYGNSFGQSDRARAKWTQGLAAKVKDARKEPVDCLWFVGDYASYDPRVQEITRTVAGIFQKAGLDFGILYEGERNAGNDVRRVGEEGLFGMLQDYNMKSLGKAQYKRLTTTDPHTYNALKNEYPLSGAPVSHYTELLDQLIREGRLPLKKRLDLRATYHDPCYLGRYNGVYDAPRRVLEALGIRLQEMPRNRAGSHCCGAGGGRIWLEDQPGIKERPSENRIREAMTLGVKTFVVACPKDIAMFRDAVKTTGQEGKIEVKDVAELVWEAMDGARKEEPQ